MVASERELGVGPVAADADERSGSLRRARWGRSGEGCRENVDEEPRRGDRPARWERSGVRDRVPGDGPARVRVRLPSLVRPANEDDPKSGTRDHDRDDAQDHGQDHRPSIGGAGVRCHVVPAAHARGLSIRQPPSRRSRPSTMRLLRDLGPAARPRRSTVSGATLLRPCRVARRLLWRAMRRRGEPRPRRRSTSAMARAVTNLTADNLGETRSRTRVTRDRLAIRVRDGDHRQAVDCHEVTRVARIENQSIRKCHRGDHHVVRASGGLPAGPAQGCRHLPERTCRFGVEREWVEVSLCLLEVSLPDSCSASVPESSGPTESSAKVMAEINGRSGGRMDP